MSGLARKASGLMRCTRWIVVLAMLLGLALPHHHDTAEASHGHAPAAVLALDASGTGGGGHDHGPAKPDGTAKTDCCLQHAPCFTLPETTAGSFAVPPRAVTAQRPPAAPVLSDPLLDRLERPPRSAA